MKRILFFISAIIILTTLPGLFAQTGSKISQKEKAVITTDKKAVLDKTIVDAKDKEELKTDDKNRQYKIVNGRKVLVDNNGMQSFANPDYLDTHPVEKKATGIKTTK